MCVLNVRLLVFKGVGVRSIDTAQLSQSTIITSNNTVSPGHRKRFHVYFFNCNSHQALRDQYKLRTINPISGTLKDELESGKFTIVVSASVLVLV